jgi:hypothetical protein
VTWTGILMVFGIWMAAGLAVGWFLGGASKLGGPEDPRRRRLNNNNAFLASDPAQDVPVYLAPSEEDSPDEAVDSCSLPKLGTIGILNSPK